MTITDIDKIVAALKEAADAYYNDDPIMSDAEYDALEDQLREMEPKHPFFKRVGASTKTSGWRKVKHSAPMGSLNKAQHGEGDGDSDIAKWCLSRIDALESWIRQSVRDASEQGAKLRAVKKAELVVSEKLDGISISLRYEDGDLVQAVTRGDGTEGEDITKNVLLMKGIQTKAANFSGFLRGEIVLCRSDHKTHVPDYKNPRNAASGIAKRQSDNLQCKHLTILHYQVIREGGKTLKDKATEFKLLEKLGCAVPNWNIISASTTQIAQVYDDYVNNLRDQLDYEIDGLVIEFNDPDYQEILGEKGGRPAGAVAYKFPHEQKPSTLKEVVWQVGASGRITPVAIFDTVDLMGASVSRASLANIVLIEEMGLTEGAKILISRRNDVIPKVEKVLRHTGGDPITAPSKCPVCSTDTIRSKGSEEEDDDAKYIVCPNVTCPAQVSGLIRRWVEKIGVKHVGKSLIVALCAAGVREPADLYALDANVLATFQLSGKKVGESAAKRAVDNLAAKKELPLALLVGSLGIHLCGRTTCEVVVDAGFDTLGKMLDATKTQIAAIDKMGSTRADAFVDGLHARKGLIDNLLDAGVRIKKPIVGGKLSGKTFCFTGIRDKVLETAIADAGGKVKGSVSKTLTYLVARDPKSTTGKPQKARDFGVSIIGVEELRAML